MEEISFEKHNKVSGIYLISFKCGEYKYIGQSKNLWKRKKEHLYILGKQKHNNKKLQSVYNKYDDIFFYELKICEKSELNLYEQFFIDMYFDSYNKCLNILPTASSFSGFKHGAEFKLKCSRRLKGVSFSESHKLKISKANKGRFMSDEWRKNIGLSKIGNTYVKGQKRTKEQKLRMSIAQKLKTDNKKKFSELNIARRKPILQIDQNGNVLNEFESIASAGNKGFDRKAVSNCANGKKEKYLNCIWKFK